MSTFGAEMLAIMAERGLSLRKLAKIAHYTDGYLSRLSRDIRIPSADAAQAIDVALGAGGRLVALAQTAQGDADQAGSLKEEYSVLEDDDEMHRRRLLQALAALGVVSAPKGEALGFIRTGMDHAIGRDEYSHVDEWEETVVEYSYSYLLLPPHRLLKDLAADLATVQQIISRQPDTRPLHSWYRVSGGLAMLVAKTLCNLDEPRLARDWWSTAQYAADLSGDTDLGLWIRGEHLMHGLYDGRPTAILLRKANQVIGRASGVQCRGLLHLHAVRSQLLALEKPGKEAMNELRVCRDIFQQLPTSVTGDVRSIAGWAEDRLRYTEAWVYAHTGEAALLDGAVARGQSLLPTDDLRVGVQLDLLRAAGHVRAGDAAGGIRHAHTLYEAQPQEHRTALVTSLARQVAEAVPEDSRGDPNVTAYRELLSSGTECKAIT
ncbi:helix-turn-helix domain-containing protein [Actinomadura macra]|uniref:helix-turn-helix domain-containing protein n=1 Tax=Actinomadura macra TaxID=46164 RepID=UPI00082E22FE|nr:helix-turn-helix transcriptional regulator [Actinomadura macra]